MHLSEIVIKAAADNHLRVQDQTGNSCSRLTTHSKIFFPNIADFPVWLLNPGIDNLHCFSNTDVTLNTRELA